MSRLSDRLSPKKARDIKVLSHFVTIYCREKHTDIEKSRLHVKDEALLEVIKDKDLLLCPDCQKLLSHGMAKLLLCTQDPKPMCKKCQVHCYAPGYRENIREVMKFSGLYLVRHGRLDLMAHYFL